MARKKLKEEEFKKNRSVRISDIDEMLLSEEFKTRQKALNFLIDFLEIFPKKAAFYKEQVSRIKDEK